MKDRSAPVPGFPNVRADEHGRVWLWSGSCWRQLLPGSQGRVWATTDSGKRVPVKVARLACAAWHGVPQPGWAVVFADEDRSNFRPSNLSWSQQQRTGVPRKVSRLDEEDIRERAAAGETLTALAREFGVSISTCSTICKGRKKGGKSVARFAWLTAEQRAEVVRQRKAGVKELAVAVRFKRTQKRVSTIMREEREREQQACSPLA